MLELCPVVTPQEIIVRIEESGSVPTPSTSSTASLTQAAEDVEPEDTVSDPAVLLTSCERAKDVVERGLLMLDRKLAVFTVVSTQEPRLVKLFHRLFCSCPATATCYHILASKMAVGMAVHDAHMGTVNLTQLRRNKRKRANKTSGRKQPQLRDVNVGVEPADDTDNDIAALLTTAITGSSQSSETVSPQSSECDTQQVAESDQPPTLTL